MKVLALLGEVSSKLTIVIPDGACPMFITLPDVSWLEDCNVKSENNPSVSIYALLAVKSVGLLIVKLMLNSEFIPTWFGAEMLNVSIGFCGGVGVGEVVGFGVGVGAGSVIFVKVLAKK